MMKARGQDRYFCSPLTHGRTGLMAARALFPAQRARTGDFRAFRER
jgi:hypothetical protein